jgi:lysyl-tRNA synthetase class 1
MSQFISLDEAIKSNSWPFLEAVQILKNINYKAPKKGYVLFETGYGPSGLPHIGTFAEVARTIMVQKAFEQISDIPTKLICFSDDLDGLRKVPSNIPNKEMIASYINLPLTSVPDPYNMYESYGHYMNAKLRSFLDRFNFQYEFYSSTECYKSGFFDNMMIKVLEKYDEIMDLMIPTFRAERQATYSPFMPICPTTGMILQVPIEATDLLKHTISYRDINGTLIETSVKSGGCKLQWKPDFGMRWAALDVDYEMYGKDHRPNAQLYSSICNILGGKEPIQFFYELFLNEEGAKISKSKGNSITVDEWLKYAPEDSLSLFMYSNPTRAKRLHFDVIPKNVDEYIIFNHKYHAETDLVKKLANPLYHIHNGDVPIIHNFGISFGLLLNLVSVCNSDNKKLLWNFIKKYAPNANFDNIIYMDMLLDHAINYYHDFVKHTKKYPVITEKHINILNDILFYLRNLTNNATSEEIQTELYNIGSKVEYKYDNLREYFKEIYQILLGQEEGPRLGSFIKLFGINQTIELIEASLLRN